MKLSKEIEKNREAGYRLGMLSKNPSSDVLVIDLNRQTLISKDYSFLDSSLTHSVIRRNGRSAENVKEMIYVRYSGTVITGLKKNRIKRRRRA